MHVDKVCKVRQSSCAGRQTAEWKGRNTVATVIIQENNESYSISW